MRNLTAKIRNRHYEIVFSDEGIDPGTDGNCDPPTARRPKIRIRPHLTGERLLEVILHEIEHAAHWTEAEDAVQEIAEQKADILTRLGLKFPQ